MNQFRHIFRELMRFLLRNSPIRTGKIPLLNLLTKIGLASNYKTIARFDRGILIHVDLDDWIQKQIFFFGSYLLEKSETVFWCDLVKKGDVVLDIGANIGYYSLLASGRIGPEGKVYAFEPVPSTFDMLKRNITINQMENIIPVNVAVSDFFGTIAIYPASSQNSGMSSIIPHSDQCDEVIEVNTLRIDQYVLDQGVKRVDVVKIDVEGAEMMVLKGMHQVLELYAPVVCIELINSRLEEAGSSVEEVYNFFADLRYSPYEIYVDSHLIPLVAKKEGAMIVFSKKRT
jgi:FkbM family methyltransferase